MLLARRTLLATALALTLLSLPAAAQVGHPAKGSWIGFYGPSESEQNRLRLLLEWVTVDWNDNHLTGVINPGPNGVRVERAEIDYSDWTLTIEADMPRPGGGSARFVATGQLENLGSWTNRRYSGTYVHGEERGRFLVILN
jgi:hypothetical protein